MDVTLSHDVSADRHCPRRQAMLLIVLLTGALMGSLSMLLRGIPQAVLPDVWLPQPTGGLAILLASLCLLLMPVARHWRGLAAVPTLLLGLYSVVQDGLMVALPQLPLVPTLPPGVAPIAALLLMQLAAYSMLERHTTVSRRLGRLTAWLSIAAGSGGLLSWLARDQLSDTLEWLGVSPLGGVFALLLGGALQASLGKGAASRPCLSRQAQRAGVMGVVLSFAVWLLASGSQFNKRLTTANHLSHHIASDIAAELEQRALMMQRMARRWAAADETLTAALKEVEARTYLDDEPSFLALTCVGCENDSDWRASATPDALIQLMDTLTTANTLRWLRETLGEQAGMAWYMPEAYPPTRALLATRAVNSDRILLALVDLDRLVDLDAWLPGDSAFALSVHWNDRRVAALPSERWEDAMSLTSLAKSSRPLPSGPDLSVAVWESRRSLAGVAGMLPLLFGLLGLFFTYQMIVTRQFAAVQEQQNRALRHSEKRFASLFHQHADAVFGLTREGIFRDTNSVTAKLLGQPAEALIGQHFTAVLQPPLCLPDDRGTAEASFQKAQKGVANIHNIRLHPPGQTPRTLEVQLLPSVVDFRVEGVFGIARDITQRTQAEQELRLLERSLESSSNGVAILEVKGSKAPLSYVNPAFSHLTGYQKHQVLGISPAFLVGESTDIRHVEAIKTAMRQGKPHSTTLKAYRRDKSTFWCQLFLSPVTDAHHRISHFVVILNDISQQREQEQQLAYQATHDALTGLGNRSLLEDRLAHDVALAKRHDAHLAVLFIDLDEFKPINDTLGHQVGDALLKSVAERLQLGRHVQDTLVRFGGDEFVLLLPDLASLHDAERIAEELLAVLNQPHRIGYHELHVSASIGIAYLTKELEDPNWLLRQADMAMYQAKQQGRNTYSVYHAGMDRHLSRRVQLRHQLQEAIDQEQLILHYQPILDTRHRVVVLEALVRWQHPTQGFISPGDFIPLAEETGQIIPLSRWVKERACRDTKTLIDAGLFQGRVAVNLSPVQFHRPQFLEGLRDTLTATGLPAKHLELELTEGILMRDSAGAIDQLHALAAMGVTTAIDDFGTGFSSLSYLKNLPVHKVKIDRSFVSQVVDNRSDMATCQGVLTLAGELGLAVVAEGIETEHQRDILARMGCPLFQGYWFARPMPLAALESWLEEQACQAGR